MPADDEEGLPAAEAFAVLGNEHRIDILRAVADAEREAAERGDPYALSFSELFDRVDADASSQFAYHLDRLTGAFLQETDDGYRFTAAGERVVRSVLAGTYTEDPTFDPVTVEGRCPACDTTTLEAAYDGDRLAVHCADCGTHVFSQTLPPSAVRERSPGAVLESGSRRSRQDFSLAVRGTCPTCAGVTDVDARRGDTDEWLLVCACRQCGQSVFAPVAFAVLDHPAVVAFHWEHGVNLADRPVWRLVVDLLSDRWSVDVETEAPFAATLTVTFGDDELHVDLGADYRVVRARTVTTRPGDPESSPAPDSSQQSD